MSNLYKRVFDIQSLDNFCNFFDKKKLEFQNCILNPSDMENLIPKVNSNELPFPDNNNKQTANSITLNENVLLSENNSQSQKLKNQSTTNNLNYNNLNQNLQDYQQSYNESCNFNEKNNEHNENFETFEDNQNSETFKNTNAKRDQCTQNQFDKRLNSFIEVHGKNQNQYLHKKKYNIKKKDRVIYSRYNQFR